MKKQTTLGFKALILMLLALQNQLIASATFSITEFGAVPDGKTINTKAIQKALDKAFDNGGGTVIVPKGVFMTGTIFIKSNTILRLEPGSRILGSGDIKDYIAMTWGGDGNRDRQPYHLVAAKDAENIAIEGLGTIDGNGKAFWIPEPKTPRWILAKPDKVSPMVELQGCKDVHIRDITLTNPAGWTMHLFDDDRVTIDGIRIENNLFSPNSDGIDMTGSQDVMINNCHISTCDDAICLKTSPDSRECRRVTVTNCIIRTMCVGLKIGNESYKDFGQVTFSNCVVYGSSRPIGIYTEDGGNIEDVTISNISAETCTPFIFNRPIHISSFAGKNAKTTGIIKNVLISNFICKTDGRILITAENGSFIENLTLRDISLNYPMIENPELYVEGARSKQFSPKNPDAKKAKAAIVAENVKNMVVDGLIINWPGESIPKEWQQPEKIEHGGPRVFTPDYSKPKQTDLSVIWGRNLQGGFLNIPLANPSGQGIKSIDLGNSNITVK